MILSPPRSTLFPYTTLFRSISVLIAILATVLGTKRWTWFILAPLSLALILATVWLLARSQIPRSEEHTSELQSQSNLVCRLLPEKKKQRTQPPSTRRCSTTSMIEVV